tara:strand:+ start:187 stop:1635 length:1449 start_codon:yes stop_codon:yes gene_type:complete
MSDYSDPTKYKVHGLGDPLSIPKGYPNPIDSDPIISNYLLALYPQWNTILNPSVNLAREGASISNTKRSLGNDAQLRNQAQEYFKTNPPPYSEPPKVRAKKPDSVFSSFEPTVSITDIIPSIPQVQAASAITIPDFVNISTSLLSENSVSINWTPRNDGGSPITGYHFVLKNEDTDQTIKEKNLLSGARNSFETNLTKATNYTAYIIAINAVGNSLESSISFKTAGIVSQPTQITLSAETLSIINKFDTGIYKIMGTYPLNTIIELVKSGRMTNEDFIKTVKANLEFGQFVDTSVIAPPTVDKSINSMMVSQSIGAFILKDGILKGEILYIANTAFNPFYYSKSKNLISFVQINSKSGIPLIVKPNGLNFTATERDERIQIDEGHAGELKNYKEITIDFLVLKSPNDMRAFTPNKQIQVVEELPPLNGDDKFKPCQIGYHKDFSGTCVPDDPPAEIPRDKLMETLKGFLFGTIALSLLARKY